LVLDHDETSVDSTPAIHYPAYIEIMRVLRPKEKPLTLEGWFKKNFHPGVMHYYEDELEFTKEELKKEYEVWRRFTTNMLPEFYEGIIPALEEFKKGGGLIGVVSHSEKELIEKHYQEKSQGFRPDMIIGWTKDKEKNKPSPWPVYEIVKVLGVRPKEILVIDDLKPGIEMAINANVDAAAAGWAYRKHNLNIPEIEDYMKSKCIAYFDTIEQFRRFILSEEKGNKEEKEV
jgi:phosphoglycolate phosphatase/pyrophosphatase PpaX